jgi:hypothetical protein
MSWRTQPRRFAGVIAGLGGGDAATREVARLARSRNEVTGSPI